MLDLCNSFHQHMMITYNSYVGISHLLFSLGAKTQLGSWQLLMEVLMGWPIVKPPPLLESITIFPSEVMCLDNSVTRETMSTLRACVNEGRITLMIVVSL